jgi:hypothetical protein
MDEAERSDVAAAIGAALEPHRGEDGSYRVPGRSLVAAAGA